MWMNQKREKYKRFLNPKPFPNVIINKIVKSLHVKMAFILAKFFMLVRYQESLPKPKKLRTKDVTFFNGKRRLLVSKSFSCKNDSTIFVIFVLRQSCILNYLVGFFKQLTITLQELRWSASPSLALSTYSYLLVMNGIQQFQRRRR